MTKPTIYLSTVTDAEIEEMIAVHVAKLIKCDQWGPGPHPLMGVMKTNCGHERCHPEEFWPPSYLRNANEVLTLLGEDWDCRVRNKDSVIVTICRPSEQFDAHAHTFNRAACIALLRASGVEVKDTP